MIRGILTVEQVGTSSGKADCLHTRWEQQVMGIHTFSPVESWWG
jgi:hypothetical protein